MKTLKINTCLQDNGIAPNAPQKMIWCEKKKRG